MSLAAMDLALALRAVFEEERECEHDFHSTPSQAGYHSGKAEWYIQTNCTDCKRKSPVLAVCDRFRVVAETMETVCSRCLTKAPTQFLVKERIGSDV